MSTPPATARLLALLALAAPSASLSASLSAAPDARELPRFEDEVQAALDAAGKDPARLRELAERWTAAGELDPARAAWRRVLALDADDAAAHAGLGHHAWEGRWYESYAALSAARREDARERLRERGEARLGDAWVPVEDLPFLRMGWVRRQGRFVHPDVARRLDAEEEAQGAGAQLQGDRTWVPADEVGRWTEGLWRVGDEWLSKDEANARHADLDRPWELPSAHFAIATTVDRDSGEWVKWWADRTWDDLVRLFGTAPATPPPLLVVADIPQYNAVAGGDPARGRAPGEGTGWSSMHYAFFAEARFDRTATPPRWDGTAVAYWDAREPSLAPYGQHAVRHAAGLAFVEGIDPSWAVVGGAVAGDAPYASQAFWAEKRIPLWLRTGAATYVERWFRDADAEQPWWARDWARTNLAALGGPRPVDVVLSDWPEGTDPERGARWVQECGALVSFVLDGDDAQVTRAHRAFVAALGPALALDAAREPERARALAEAVADLERALVAAEPAFRAYVDGR